ncbi:MAG: MFS transporter [Leptospiraceae bacterium]|nr:MFS transporter [Leptospiraceae bacterium]
MSGISRAAKAAILVSALGYFVDIYDLLLFLIVRKPSLASLGIPDTGLAEYLFSIQMAGMLVGGIFWGVLGDKKGRLSVLFGSITMYSLANIANAFITNIEQYAILRFVAGIGLAGELGAGVTLVSELMPKDKRGYGTMIVAGFGIFGAVAASLIGKFLTWQTAYIIGGVGGIALLLLRIGVTESGMFEKVLQHDVARGSFLSLFANRARAFKYLNCILIGVPLWFVVGILIGRADKFGAAQHALFTPDPGIAIGITYFTLALGDFVAGALSQFIGSRKKIVLYWQLMNIVAITLFLLSSGYSEVYFYGFCAVLGFINGYWAVFVTIAAEQFGTNIRSTVTTTVPNFVRGSVSVMTPLFLFLTGKFGKSANDLSGMIPAAFIVGAIAFLLALWALSGLEESHGKDLDYNEVA